MFQSLFRNLTPVVKNLLIINAIFYLAQLLVPGFTDNFILYYIESPYFKAYQIATHFFMHSTNGFTHILFNMFTLIMFGPALEKVWGAQRFLLFYFITGFGAAFLHLFVNWIEIQQAIELISEENVLRIKNEGGPYFSWNSDTANKLNSLYHSRMLGASGAISGVLAAFAYYFPNTQLMLLFPPIPVKAKYLVLILLGLDLFLGLGSFGTGIAHFAHLGGALFGIILVLIWKKDNSRFY